MWDDEILEKTFIYVDGWENLTLCTKQQVFVIVVYSY